MPINIVNDVPAPASSKSGPARTYPWEKMKIGDSFVMPMNKTKGVHTSVRFYAIAHPGFKIRTKKEGKNRRVWRIA